MPYRCISHAVETTADLAIDAFHGFLTMHMSNMSINRDGDNKRVPFCLGAYTTRSTAKRPRQLHHRLE